LITIDRRVGDTPSVVPGCASCWSHSRCLTLSLVEGGGHVAETGQGATIASAADPGVRRGRGNPGRGQRATIGTKW